MTGCSDDLIIETLDPISRVIYLEVPASKIVMFQAYFELSEGLGTVRTLDVKKSLLCVLTTSTMLPDCLSMLQSIKEKTHWRSTPAPGIDQKQKFLGYQKSSAE